MWWRSLFYESNFINPPSNSPESSRDNCTPLFQEGISLHQTPKAISYQISNYSLVRSCSEGSLVCFMRKYERSFWLKWAKSCNRTPCNSLKPYMSILLYWPFNLDGRWIRNFFRIVPGNNGLLSLWCVCCILEVFMKGQLKICYDDQYYGTVLLGWL